MTHLYLIRHAEYLYDLVDGQYPKRNLGLTPEGIKQAERLRDRLAHTGEIKPDVFIASTERGALETAAIIAPAIGVSITPEQDVEEWRSEDGTLSTEAFLEPWNRLSPAERPYYRWVKGCETLIEFSLRVHVVLHRILEEYQGKTILIMTHGAFIQVSFAYFFGYSMAVPQPASPEISKTSITHWYKRERWILERSNDCHHLS